MAFIIYAEDDELMGELVQVTLMSAGHGVGVLGDGDDALQILRRRKPDLLILDINMPRMSGSEVLAAIRRDPELYNLPVLMLTARRETIDEHIARAAGANDYLRKPFDPDELIAVVNRLLVHAPDRHGRPAARPRTI